MAIREVNRKGKTKYQIDYFNAHGKRKRQTFDNKITAQREYMKRTKGICDIYETVSLKDLIIRYEMKYKNQKSFESFKKYSISLIEDFFGSDTLISNISRSGLEQFKKHLSLKTEKGYRKKNTINRYMVVLHHMFVLAKKECLIDKSPFNTGDRVFFKEGKSKAIEMNDLLFDKVSKKISNAVEILMLYEDKDYVSATLNILAKKGCLKTNIATI